MYMGPLSSSGGSLKFFPSLSGQKAEAGGVGAFSFHCLVPEAGEFLCFWNKGLENPGLASSD